MNRIVLSLCDRTGVMVRPWLEAGFECWLVDRQHPAGIHDQGGGLYTVGADLMAWSCTEALRALGRDPVITFAFPPCSDVAISGALYFKDKGLERLHASLGLLIACKAVCEAFDRPWMIENPVSTFSTYWRAPDHVFHPWQYARYLADVKQESYSKKTCLWIGNGFVIPAMKPASFLPEGGSWALRFAPSADRPDQRAVTPAGFARAVFEANEPLIRELTV